MATKVNNQFEQILLAAKERRGDLSVDSMIVNSHLSQMRMFMLVKDLSSTQTRIATDIAKSFFAKYVKTTCLR